MLSSRVLSLTPCNRFWSQLRTGSPSVFPVQHPSLFRTMSHYKSTQVAAPAGSGTNRLAEEQSPYLLQHQHNPVDWYPWGPEALAKAKREDKCHVMEHESFEDQETADLLNKDFVCVKVDREERPDVDRVYMAFVQALTGRGGWPMSVWLTPDLEPFYGGTYYPKKDIMQDGRLAMPSFTTVLRRIVTMCQTNREDLKAKGTSIMSQLQEAVEQGQQEEGEEGIEHDLAVHAVQTCTQQLKSRFDSALGGFGGAPKFPRPSEINALLTNYALAKVSGDDSSADDTLHMATFSLDKMAAGGMYDHVGGGFHRYSVDEYWHVPHYEKMLYDNPQLVLTYLSAFQITANRSYAATARGALDYLRRDMTSPQGGLYSAEDADSMNPEEGRKTEGYFYVWTKQEIDDILGPELSPLFCEAYYIKPDGNTDLSRISDPHEEFGGKNVPIILQPLAQIANKHNMSLSELESKLATARQLLHSARSKRGRPGLDNKIVTAWNGQAVSAFSLASRILTAEEPQLEPCFPIDGLPAAQYLQSAVAAANFVKQELWDASSGTLKRSYCRTASSVEGFADDYALLISGLLDLYSAGGGLEWLQWAVQLQGTMDSLFWDNKQGGYFATTTTDSSIKLRMKESYDGAEPAASSIAAANLYRLAGLLPDAAPDSAALAGPGPSASSSSGGAALTYLEKAERTLAAFTEQLFQSPIAMPQMCSSAYLKTRQPMRQVIVSCGPDQQGGLSVSSAQQLIDAVHKPFAPDKTVLLIDLTKPSEVSFWDQHNKAALNMAQAHYTAHPGTPPAVFVCQNYSCQVPSSEPAKVVQLLRDGGTAAKVKPTIFTQVDKLPGM